MSTTSEKGNSKANAHGEVTFYKLYLKSKDMQHKNELEVPVKHETNSVYCIQYWYLIFDTWNYLNLFFSCKSRCVHLLIYPLIQYQFSKILPLFNLWKTKCKHRLPNDIFRTYFPKRKERNNCWSLFNINFFNIWRPHKGQRWPIC